MAVLCTVLPETSLNTSDITFLHTPIVRMPPVSANGAAAVLLSSVVLSSVIVYDWGRFYHYFDQ